jgi:hypothetical protein
VKIEPLKTRKIPCSATRPGNGLKIRRLRPVYILFKSLFMNDLQNNLARAKTAVFGDMSAFSAHPSDFPSAARPQPKGIRRCTLIIADETSVHCIHWRDFRASQRASNKRTDAEQRIQTRTRSCADSLFRIKPCPQGCPGDSGRRLFTINISRSTIYTPPPSEPLGGSSSEAGGKIPAVHENVRSAILHRHLDHLDPM